MNRLVFAVLAIFTAGIVNAEQSAEQAAALRLVQNKKMLHFGGALIMPDSQKGKILFVNVQKTVPQAELSKVTVPLARTSRLNIGIVADTTEVTPMNALETRKRLGGDVAVFLVESDKSNTVLLTAPEEGWSIVNVTALVKDAPSEAFKAARLRKEMTRAFFVAAGAMNSQYHGSIMGGIRSPKELDEMVEEMPMDVYSRTLDSLQSVGVSPAVVTTYERACERGSAPEPTNEVQKAIWDKYHEVPTRGIEIKFDPKKGK